MLITVGVPLLPGCFSGYIYKTCVCVVTHEHRYIYSTRGICSAKIPRSGLAGSKGTYMCRLEFLSRRVISICIPSSNV